MLSLEIIPMLSFKLLETLIQQVLILTKNSDHNTVLIKSHFQRPQNRDNRRLFKRDFRDSNIRLFGQWITTFDWDVVLSTSDCNEKYDKFDEIISSMIEYYYPLNKTKICKSDMAWMIPSVRIAIAKRQKAFHIYGENSEGYKF